MREITSEDSTDRIWSDLVFTYARLEKTPLTNDLAAAMQDLIDRLDDIHKGQRKVRHGCIVSDAGVDVRDELLDEDTTAFGRDLFHAEKDDRKSPRWKRYFPVAVYEVVRLGLQSQIAKIVEWGWPSSLAQEKDGMKKYAKVFEQRIAEGSDALAERSKARAARSDFKLRVLTPFLEDVNAVRRSIHAELAKRAVDHKLKKDWPSKFFRTIARVKADESDENATTDATTDPGVVPAP